MWELRAEYSDGSSYAGYVEYDSTSLKTDSDIQYDLEAWLIDRHDGCVWYSVTYITQ